MRRWSARRTGHRPSSRCWQNAAGGQIVRILPEYRIRMPAFLPLRQRLRRFPVSGSRLMTSMTCSRMSRSPASARMRFSRSGRPPICLAESHTQAPARKLLSQVLPLHQRVRSLLGGRLRLSQQRELYRVESLLLSHACLLLGDLNENDLAERYGMAGLAFAREAGSDQAVAMTVLAKTFRWQKRLTESMDMARRGFACSPDAPIRVQLASQEANAAALLGDAVRAREALARAERAAESVPPDSGLSAWSFPVTRQAVFAQSVATQLGDADAMLEAASAADAAWSAGAPRVSATWAQIRVGAGIAHLLNGSPDGAAAEVEPVLALPPGMRVATVTAYTERLRRRLEHPRYDGAAGIRELAERLAQFNADALSDPESQED